MTDLADLLAVVAIFTGIHFIASSLRNWRDAIRLVPIGSIDPEMVKKHGTVPLCFAGGNTLLMHLLAKTYGRLFITPKAKKQAVLCDNIAFIERDRSYQYRQNPVHAGMIIQTKTAEGENSYHVRKSARRCTIGNELALALLLPSEDGECFQTSVRCITVRARARTNSDDTSIVPNRTIEWEVVDPAGIGAETDTRLSADKVPLSAFWLVSLDHDSDISEPNPKLRNFFYPYGSNRLRGFASYIVLTVSKLTLAILAIGTWAILADSSFDSAVEISAVILMLYILYRLFRMSFKDDLPERRKLQAPRFKKKLLMFGRFKSSTYLNLEWHGSTRRSLAIGDRIRRVAFWQQFKFNHWEPFMDRLKTFMDRLKKCLDWFRKRLRGQPSSN